MSREENETAYYDTLAFIDRFENLREVQKIEGLEFIPTRFTHYEVMKLLYLLKDLKFVYERSLNDD